MAEPDSRLGPSRVPPGPAVVTAAQAEVLDRLRERFAPVTARDLAQDTGLHVNTVREHLDALVARGLATRHQLAAPGRGRPSFGYLASPVLTDLQAQTILVDALSDHLAEIADDPVTAAETLGRRYSWRLQPTVAGDDDPLTRVAAHMTRLGFSPELDEQAGTARLVTCPLLDAASRHRDVVCGFHRGLAQGLAGAEPSQSLVALEAFAEPGACLLTVTGATS